MLPISINNFPSNVVQSTEPTRTRTEAGTLMNMLESVSSDPIRHFPSGTASPSSLKEELFAKREEFQTRLYCKDTVKYAKLWGVDDLCSVRVILKIFKGSMSYENFEKEMPNSMEKIYLIGATKPQCVGDGRIRNDPDVDAPIADDHHLNELANHSISGKPTLEGRCAGAFDLPHGGLKFIVSLTPSKQNFREKAGLVQVMCSFADVVKCGGRIYHDYMGRADAVIVELPQWASMPVNRAIGTAS